MGEIIVDLPQEMIVKIDEKIHEKAGDHLSDQVLWYLQPWIEQITRETEWEQEEVELLQMPLYIQKEGNRFRYARKIDGKICCFTSDLETLNIFKKEADECRTQEEFIKLRNKFKKPRKLKTHIYAKYGGYICRWGVNNKCLDFGATSDLSKIEKINDYVQWYPDKIELYNETRGRDKCNRLLKRLNEDKEYQEYLRSKEE